MNNFSGRRLHGKIKEKRSGKRNRNTFVTVYKNVYPFVQINKLILAKKKSYVTSFFVEHIFFHNLLITFRNYLYVKSMFSAPLDFLIFYRFLSYQEVCKILSESHFWLGMLLKVVTTSLSVWFMAPEQLRCRYLPFQKYFRFECSTPGYYFKDVKLSKNQKLNLNFLSH